MTQIQKRASLHGVFGFVVFCTFFTVVTVLFVEPVECTVGPIRCGRQLVAILFVYGLGFIVARLEYRRALAEPESRSIKSSRGNLD